MAQDLKIAFVGDLHFYDGPTKSHKDYYANCIDVMKRYTASFEKNKPDYILLAGDIIGLSERCLRSRVALAMFISFLKVWNEICHGNLYAISGNHDYSKGSAMADFDLMNIIGYIKSAKYIDVNSVRVHMIDYGNEREEISVNPDMTNVALMHANLQIDGHTTWFHADEGIALSSLRNLKGVELVLCGHIHEPSPRICTTSIEDASVSLLYLGCGTRPKRKDKWTAVYTSYLTCFAAGGCDFQNDIIQLKPCDEIFTEQAVAEEATVEDVEEEAGTVDIELLTKILDELSPALMGSEFDYRAQIKRLAGLDEAAAEVAISYIDKADEHAAIV